MAKPVWQTAAERDMGVKLGNWQQLAGGDFAQSWRASIQTGSNNTEPAVAVSSQSTTCLNTDERERLLQSGTSIFIKTHSNPPPQHFTTESKGLIWLREIGSLQVPAVLGVSDDPPYLALQWIEEGNRASCTESDLGAGLALLHQAECSYFGREDERTTGSLGLPNKPCKTWSEFYASQRLYPLAKIAHERQALSGATINKIERLADGLDSLFPHMDTTPSRLHGDLWAGNRLVDSDGVNWLIDPACHGGHREFDLAMMRLFGGYGEACFAIYQDQYPLDSGWQDRIPLHQLAPLIVHAIKFGQSYVAPTEDALDLYL